MRVDEERVAATGRFVYVYRLTQKSCVAVGLALTSGLRRAVGHLQKRQPNTFGLRNNRLDIQRLVSRPVMHRN